MVSVRRGTTVIGDGSNDPYLPSEYSTLHGFWSIIRAIFARGVVTPVAPKMKDRDIHDNQSLTKPEK